MITLNAKQIRDLAEYCGFTVDTHDIELDTELDIMKCPEIGVLDEDDGKRHHYGYIACLSEYPEEGVMGLGDEIGA